MSSLLRSGHFLNTTTIELSKMKLCNILPIVFLSWAAVKATPVSKSLKPPYFLLIGDSTVAVRGGWGDGLLSYLKEPAQGENRGKSGSTTVSWKANGRWDNLLEALDAYKADYEPIVTIQFGHNDQKSMTLEEYRANLKSLVVDIEDAGGVPVCDLFRKLDLRRDEF